MQICDVKIHFHIRKKYEPGLKRVFQCSSASAKVLPTLSCDQPLFITGERLYCLKESKSGQYRLAQPALVSQLRLQPIGRNCGEEETRREEIYKLVVIIFSNLFSDDLLILKF